MLALCSFLFNERVPTFKFISHLDIVSTEFYQLSLSVAGRVEPVTISFVL